MGLEVFLICLQYGHVRVWDSLWNKTYCVVSFFMLYIMFALGFALHISFCRGFVIIMIIILNCLRAERYGVIQLVLLLLKFYILVCSLRPTILPLPLTFAGHESTIQTNEGTWYGQSHLRYNWEDQMMSHWIAGVFWLQIEYIVWVGAMLTWL